MSTDTTVPEGDGPSDDARPPQRVEVPPVVYLPVTGTGNGTLVEVELRQTNDGRTALLAYTALDRLHTCCGPHQPWALMPTDRLGEIEQTQPYDVIYLDMAIPPELHRGAEGDDREVVDG